MTGISRSFFGEIDGVGGFLKKMIYFLDFAW